MVDLGRWRGSTDDRAALVDEVKTICHEVGFFLVVNHGVDRQFVDSIFEMMQQLFALSPEEKSLIDKRRSRHFRGWERVGAERTNNRTDIREQVDTWSETPARRPDAEPAYLRLLGPNQWLPDDVLPGFRDLTLDWFTRLGALADELSLMLREIRLGTTRSDALRGLAKRCAVPEVASFSSVLIQADRLGASIGQVLRSQADIMRAERFVRAEKAGARASTMILLPLVIFILPAALLVIVGPVLLRFIYGIG